MEVITIEVYISTEKVWWTSTNEDRPSSDYFNEFVNKMQKVDLKINYLDYKTLNVVANSKNITYIKISHLDEVKYFYFDRVENLLNKGFNLVFRIDFYTTYTLPYLNKLKDNNTQIKVIRTHKLNEKMVQYNDPMLDAIPKVIDHVEFWCNYIQASRLNAGPPGYDGWCNKISGPDGFTLSKGDHLSGTRYYVFRFEYEALTNKQSYIFAPVLFSQLDRTNNKISVNGIDNTDLWAPDNDEVQLIDLASGLGAKKFLGVFTLPSYYEVQGWDRYKVKDSGGTVRYNLACLIINCRYGKTTNLDFAVNSIVNKYVDISNTRPSTTETKLSMYAARYLDLRIFNQPVDINFFRLKTSQYFNFGNLGFTAYNNFFDTLGNNLIQFPDLQQTITDEYQGMVASTQNVRDTSKSIAAQQAVLGTISGLLGGGLNIGTSLASGNIGSAIGGFLNTGMGLINTGLGYSNKIRMMNAQLADYRIQMGTNMSYSSNEQNAINIEGNINKFVNLPEDTTRSTYIPTLYSRISVLTDDTIKSLNRVIYLYGIFNPIWSNISNLFVNKDFNYIQFDVEYLSNIFPTTIMDNVPRELYSFILDDMTSGLRIWNTIPNY